MKPTDRDLPLWVTHGHAPTDYAPRSRVLDTFGNVVAGILFLIGVFGLVLAFQFMPDHATQVVISKESNS